MAGFDPLPGGGVCDRAREWASLRLDDELSALEEEILERHLGVCPECRGFEQRIRMATTALRAAPAEAPSRRVAVPRHEAQPRFRRRSLALIAAAALALGALVGSLVERPSSQAPAAHQRQVSLLDIQQLRDLPRQRFTSPIPEPSTPPNPPEGVI
jgi:anti-sigma factor RsiW